MQRRLWRVCTFAQAHLNLRPGTEISCAGSNNYLYTVYKNSGCCGEAAPATMAHLGNHQCLVSKRKKGSQCVVIKFLNKTLASLPRKKIQSGDRFLDVLTCKYDNSCAETCRFLSIKASYTRKKHLSRQNSRTLLDLQSKP